MTKEETKNYFLSTLQELRDLLIQYNKKAYFNRTAVHCLYLVASDDGHIVVSREGTLSHDGLNTRLFRTDWEAEAAADVADRYALDNEKEVTFVVWPAARFYEYKINELREVINTITLKIQEI